MKKYVAIGIAVAALVIAITVVQRNRVQPSVGADYKNIEYVIEGEKVRIAESYFGNELRTDLDGDGRQDVAFVIARNTGGSGTFYYAVAALNTAEGYKGSDGYFLGDRIAPQSTTVSPNPRHKYVVVFNYADRKPTEPMIARPTVGKSAYLKLDPVTMRWGVVEPDFET